MKKKERARHSLAALRTVIPSPETELHYRDPYELIVSVILSAQCTDERVNQVTPALFEVYPDPSSLASAEPHEVFQFIKSVSYPNNKSKHLVAMARLLVDRHEGRVPGTMQDLLALPGVGRKSAQVVLSVAFDEPALPVDTHVFRVACRIGLAKKARTPAHVESQLKRIVPREAWGEAHHLLILHGRYTCTAKSPKCEACPVTSVCEYHARLKKLPAPLEGLNGSLGRYFCRTCARYFSSALERQDRYGIRQIACPSCRSMNIYNARTGRTEKKVVDYRV